MRQMIVLLLLLFVSAALSASAAWAGSQAATAEQLIQRVLDARRFQGLRGSARLIRIDSRTEAREIRRLTVKMRQSGSLTTILYQAGKTKDAAAQALVLNLLPGRSPAGFLLKSTGQMTPLSDALMEEPFFGSDIRIGDLADDFLFWPSQRLMGEEVVLRRRCRILESLPSDESRTATARVRSWVSPETGLILKVEKYDSQGRLLRSLKVERITRLEGKGWVVSRLSVVPAGGSFSTMLEGTRYDSGKEVPAREFELERILPSLKSSTGRAAYAASGLCR